MLGCGWRLFIVSHLVVPAYVSYWSALYFHGFTEQVPLITFVATTKKKRPVTFRDFRQRSYRERFERARPPRRGLTCATGEKFWCRIRSWTFARCR